MFKQQLSERDTYTPRDTPQVPGSVILSLNSPEGRDSEQDLKTSDNNLDEVLTPRVQGGQDLRVPAIYVLNIKGEPLMSTNPRKARILLNKGEANVIKRTPFTIQLARQTGENKQDIILDIDTGSRHIGLSAKTENKEVFSAEVQLRTDITNLISEKRSYRRTRRNRKNWYRKPRFLNRGISKGWLAPSIQHKLDSHIKIVDKIRKILPITEINVEVANFDIQKIKNPDISGKEYQEGEQLGFWNIREYVLHRDNHKCKNCNGKNQILQVHHIESRKTGGNRPENLITLCKSCHDNYHQGSITLKIKKKQGFRDATFMNIVMWNIIEKLRETGLQVNPVYGYQTKYNRIRLGLDKNHINDAFSISGEDQVRCKSHLIKQIRKQNRKLFKGIRSHIRNTASRFIKGFQRFDKVRFKGVECFIFGRRTSGYFDIRKLSGEVISKSVKFGDLVLLESFKTLLWESCVVSSPC